MATAVPFLFSDGPTDEQLLAAALRGDRDAWSWLVRRFQPYLTTVVGRRSRGLPQDLQGEIIAEVWTAVHLRGAPAFDPHSMLARDHIASFVKDAVERVRAAYRAPGERSRARDGRQPRQQFPLGGKPPSLVALSLDALPEEEQPATKSEWESVDRGIDLDRAQSLAAPDVALAIVLIRHWDVTFEEAALMVGLTRATLLRRLAQLGRRLRAA